MHVSPLDPLLLRNFAIALFIGALVGVDRERRATEPDAGPSFGGLRTFMLVALAGASASWLTAILGTPWLVGVGLLALVGLLGVAYAVTNLGSGTAGLTGEVAAVVVYLLGAASVAGQPEVAVVLAIVTSALLAFKTPLHAWVAQVDEEDLASALKLLFATFIVLPLLPDTAIDPWGVIVPYRLWWLVVLVSGLSLLGYVAVRVLGTGRGLVLTGLFGGLASSTAVTLSAARQSKAETSGPDALAMSVLVAWGVMFVRVIVMVGVVNRALVPQVAPAMVAMAVVTGLAAAWFGRRDAGTVDGLELRNPFSLWEASKFALVFGVVLVVEELARRFVDPQWLVVIAALAGTTTVDPITLSVADLAGGTLSAGLAVTAIVVASLSNTVVKWAIVAVLGTRALAVRVGLAGLVVVVVGVVVLMVTWLVGG